MCRQINSLSISMSLEYKTIGFTPSEVKEVDLDGGRYGLVKGLFSTYGNIDEVYDKVMPGAFNKSIEQYKQNGHQIPLLYRHSELIGGIKVDELKDTSEGLEGSALINLDVQRGREAYALAKQGVISSFSIGFTTIKSERNREGIRELKEVRLGEVSMVPNPANTKAKITSVKAKKEVKSFELAPESHAWDKDAAIARIRKFTDSVDKPSARYKRAFMWYDKSKSDDFGSYKLPFVDVIDGKLKAVPRAIFAIAAVLDGGRGGVDISETDKAKIKAKVSRYYDLMDRESPFKKKYLNLEGALEIKSKRDFEEFLRDSGACTKKASVYLAKFFDEKSALGVNQRQEKKSEENPDELKEIFNCLTTLTRGLQNGNHRS